MKKIILFSLTIFITSLSFAIDASKAVKESFSKKFPTAKTIKWQKENEKEYEASFLIDGVQHSANFSNEGIWLETETSIKNTDLPAPILKTLKSNFSTWVIVAAAKIENSKMELTYEAELIKGKVKKEIFFKENGLIIKK